MTVREKRQLQTRFFKEAGPNVETFVQAMEAFREEAFYIKDIKGRIIAINRRNREICNIPSELSAIGKRSDELFPKKQAQDYMALDHEVLLTGKPVLGRITTYPADRSTTVLISSVYPLRNVRGILIGTMRTYRLATAQEADLERHGRLKDVMAYVDRHYSEDVTIAQLARIAKMSPTRFKRDFTEDFEMTPRQYVINARLNAAKELLEKTNRLIADIALSTGFYDQSHFVRAFRKSRGMTPGEYRNRHHGTVAN